LVKDRFNEKKIISLRLIVKIFKKNELVDRIRFLSLFGHLLLGPENIKK
jgi:hypothetical protein